AYIFQHSDKRIIFAIPYEKDFTLIGTTDIDYEGNPDAVKISSEEINYLCEVISHYFTTTVSPQDVRFSYAGVRPLLCQETTNPSVVTRDYRLEWEPQPALLSIFGGKITTYRKLAEEALALIYGNATQSWTSHAPLPGGDISDFSEFLNHMRRTYAALPAELVERYARTYGSKMDALLKKGLGEAFGDGLYEAEVRYLIEYEWAQTAEDILWRRTKLGLHISAETGEKLEEWLAQSRNILPRREIND
ncbi:MAG: FAD-dependent oxidoreductase, partial [Gammaproteobacteria bacterium]